MTIQIKYSELFSFSIEQLFYKNLFCRDFQVTPIPDTEIVPLTDCLNVMKNKDLVFRKIETQGKFVVLGRVLGKNSSGNDLLRFPANTPDKLSFGIVLKNPALLAQNDLPIETSGKIYYFSNQVNDNSAPRNSLHLTTDPTGVTAADLLKISGSDYHYHHTSTLLPDTVIVRHQLSQKISVPTTIINQGGEADASFNLTFLPPGKCDLLIEGIVKETFYYSGTSLLPAYFGIIEILLSSSVNSNYRVVESDRSLIPPNPYFKVVFKNRQTTWRYTFQLYPNSPLSLEIAGLNPADRQAFIDKINIISNDAAVTFKQTNVTNDTFVFESESALLLREFYDVPPGPNTPLQLKLEKNIGAAGEAVVKDNLPYPPTQLIDATNPSTIYSDIFITI